MTMSTSVSRSNKNFQGTQEISRTIQRPLENVPLVAELLDRETREVMEDYYGAYFDVFQVEVRRNLHVPPSQLKGAEAFSNWWHYDLRPTDISKLFVNLSDVDYGATTAIPKHHIHFGRKEWSEWRFNYRPRPTVEGAATMRNQNDPEHTWLSVCPSRNWVCL